MKKSDFIKEAYSLMNERLIGEKINTEEFVESMVDIFEELGMLPPSKEKYLRDIDCIWGESEAGREVIMYCLGNKHKYNKIIDIWDANRRTFLNKLKSPFEWEPENG